MNLDGIHFHISSWVAKLLEKITFGKYWAITVYTHIFISDDVPRLSTLKHEISHVNQWRTFGFFGFLYRYIKYHIKYGYTNNPLEVEARLDEKNPDEPYKLELDILGIPYV